MGGRYTARGMMQALIHQGDGQKLPQPQNPAEGRPPEKPNVYSDGSVKNPVFGPRWQVGGRGIWWPGRDASTLPPMPFEMQFTWHEFKANGFRAWNRFKGLRNSSMRAEIGAAMVAIQPPVQYTQDKTKDIYVWYVFATGK